MLEDKINSELAILLSARALNSVGNLQAASAELARLDLTLLPTDVSAAVACHSNRSMALGAAPPITPVSMDVAVNNAFDYYASVHKLLQGAFVAPEISEDAAILAINKYWQKTTLALALLSGVAVLSGGVIYGGFQVTGIRDSLHQAEESVHTVQAEIDQKRQTLENQVDDANGKVRQIDGQLKTAQTQVADKVQAAIDPVVTQLKNSISGDTTSATNATNDATRTIAALSGQVDTAKNNALTHINEAANNSQKDFDRKVDDLVKDQVDRRSRSAATSIAAILAAIQKKQQDADAVLQTIKADAADAKRIEGEIEHAQNDALNTPSKATPAYGRHPKAKGRAFH